MTPNSPTTLREAVPLSRVSTFGIGGPARYFFEVKIVSELQEALRWCSENHLRTFILGKGSNCLFDDRGFNGAVILNRIDFCDQVDARLFHVGAGYSFSRLGALTARKGLSGLEFASGIPGTVGGAVYMNAGANGAETCEALVSVDTITMLGEVNLVPKEELVFGYRTSSFHARSEAIVGATFLLTPSEKAREKQLDIVAYRTQTQPYGEKSAGCIFQNPEGCAAGALIEECGLKGKRIGGAVVSPLHANFIVNGGEATSDDILKLIAYIRGVVKEKKGIDLVPEVRLIPFEVGL